MSNRRNAALLAGLACFAVVLVAIGTFVHRKPASQAELSAIASRQTSPESAAAETTLEVPRVDTAPDETDPIPQRLAIEVSQIPKESHAERMARQRLRMNELSKVEDWNAKYGSWTRDALEKKRSEINAAIDDDTKAWFAAEFNAGRFEVVGQGSEWKSPDFDPFDTYWIKVPPPPGGPIEKVLLPESQFPEIYARKALSVWLYERLHPGAAY
jgi:hypothetical protein